ncbi:MAG: AAA family ATPase, partial [Planctomycetota bacterium]
LIGAPPGYIGYDEAGQLTESVRRRPYSVVLFDEVEKAHPEVFNALLQVLDDGRLTDGQGRTVDFRNALLILTSNLGSAEMRERPASSDAEAARRYLEVVRSFFRPEFLNRVDEIVVFRPLSTRELRRIVEIQLARLGKLLEEKRVSLVATEAARDRVAREGHDPVFGARPLKRVIQNRIANEIATRMLEGRIREGQTVVVDAVADGFTFTPREPAAAGKGKERRGSRGPGGAEP